MTWESIVSFYKKYKVFLVAGAALLALTILGTFLWGVVADWRFRSDVNEKKEAITNSLEQIKEIESNVNSDKSIANQIAANVNRDTQELLEAVNASDAARRETNAAIANMEKAKGTNRNVTAQELEELLRELDK